MLRSLLLGLALLTPALAHDDDWRRHDCRRHGPGLHRQSYYGGYYSYDRDRDRDRRDDRYWRDRYKHERKWREKYYREMERHSRRCDRGCGRFHVHIRF